jgi:uncharacterized delta-60 repeat protein
MENSLERRERMATWSERRAARKAADHADYEGWLRRAGDAKAERSTQTATLLSLLLAVLLGALTMNVMLASPAAAAAGDLDVSFGIDGRVTTDFGGSDGASEVAIQPDGKIVAAGSAHGDDFALARYNRDGSLDTSFDGDGKVTTDFGGVDAASDVAIQPDGKIVAAGGGAADFALARYNRDGSLDTSFDGDGKVTTDFRGVDAAVGVAIQLNGKIVAAGFDADADDFALVRYNRDGSLDTSFDGDGKVTTDFGSAFEAAAAVAIQPDGRIVAAGFTQVGDDFALARYNRDGSLDTSFDGDGKVTTDFGFTGPFGDPIYTVDLATGVVIQPDGKIVAAGFSVTGGVDFALARYNPDGSLDTGFGFVGKVTTSFGDLDHAFGVAIQSDGKIVAAGTTTGFGADGIGWVLARYKRDGSLDTDFGVDGQVTTDFEGVGEAASGVAIQPNGRIVAVGGATAGHDFALARYLGR